MKAILGTAGLVALLTTGMAFAKDGVTNPIVKERMDNMQTIRANMATLGGMASGKATFDEAAAVAAKTALAAAAAEIVSKFQANESDPVSEAQPAIWTNFEDFTAKAEPLVTTAEAINTSSIDALKASIGPVGTTCKSCHEAYRK